MTNPRNAHLWFAGTEPRAVSLTGRAGAQA